MRKGYGAWRIQNAKTKYVTCLGLDMPSAPHLTWMALMSEPVPLRPINSHGDSAEENLLKDSKAR